MEWIVDETPNESGSYMVSINLDKDKRRIVLKYIAYYVVEENQWYKYDPFDLNYKPKELIEGYVTAWTQGIGVYIG